MNRDYTNFLYSAITITSIAIYGLLFIFQAMLYINFLMFKTTLEEKITLSPKT